MQNSIGIMNFKGQNSIRIRRAGCPQMRTFAPTYLAFALFSPFFQCLWGLIGTKHI